MFQVHQPGCTVPVDVICDPDWLCNISIWVMILRGLLSVSLTSLSLVHAACCFFLLRALIPGFWAVHAALTVSLKDYTSRLTVCFYLTTYCKCDLLYCITAKKCVFTFSKNSEQRKQGGLFTLLHYTDSIIAYFKHVLDIVQLLFCWLFLF